jgi:hypothetical protein
VKSRLKASARVEHINKKHKIKIKRGRLSSINTIAQQHQKAQHHNSNKRERKEKRGEKGEKGGKSTTVFVIPVSAYRAACTPPRAVISVAV